MKRINYIKIMIICLITITTNAQDFSLTEKIDKSVRFGFSAGIENKFSNPHEAYLDPSALTLEFDELGKNSFVISTSLIYMPNYFYRTVTSSTDENGVVKNTFGEWEYKSSRFGGVVSLNIAEFAPDGGFNTRIDGGIGVAFAPGSVKKNEKGEYNPHPFYLTLTLDFSTIRQVKDGIKEKYEGKQILINTVPLNALDQTDNSIFTNKTFAGVSFKLVYLLN
jgi:hypothetical protein